MGIQPPFLYDSVSYAEFDPKRITRASQTPRVPRPKQDGPLVSFNQHKYHPDSYLVFPKQNSSIKPMKSSVKIWVNWIRIVLLFLRCLELLVACTILVCTIITNPMDGATAWMMRIVPAMGLAHTVYAVYHLSRKPSGRTPASSASYSLFASFLDVAIIPFYVFGALFMAARPIEGKSMLSETSNINVLVFYEMASDLAISGAGLHLVSLAFSIYLATTFRKITKMPPDMNPLEDNLTSRHKRDKSSTTTIDTSSEKRNSTNLDSKRSSRAPYEDLSRPPTIPFFHTREMSTDSFSTYRSTVPSSRDARSELPSRQFKIPTKSPTRFSVANGKCASACVRSSSPKQASYAEIPLSDDEDSYRNSHSTEAQNGWYVPGSIGKAQIQKHTGSESPKKARYAPLHQHHDSFDEHPNPLEANPPTPPCLNRYRQLTESSTLSETSINNSIRQRIFSAESGDIGDLTLETSARDEVPHLRPISSFKAKSYGELKPGTPPVMVGAPPVMVGRNSDRQVSSGNDFADRRSFRGFARREVSGKVAEEGRSRMGGVWRGS